MIKVKWPEGRDCLLEMLVSLIGYLCGSELGLIVVHKMVVTILMIGKIRKVWLCRYPWSEDCESTLHIGRTGNGLHDGCRDQTIPWAGIWGVPHSKGDSKSDICIPSRAICCQASVWEHIRTTIRRYSHRKGKLHSSFLAHFHHFFFILAHFTQTNHFHSTWSS